MKKVLYYEIKKIFDYRIVEIGGKFSAQATWKTNIELWSEIDANGRRLPRISTFAFDNLLSSETPAPLYNCLFDTREEAQESIYKSNALMDEWSPYFL